MAIRHFGTLADGTDVSELSLTGGGLSIAVLTYGAVIRSLTLDTLAGPRDMVLGLETLADYVAHSPYFGCIVGRYANRIGGGRFTLDGVAYQLGLNEAGRSHLHGGRTGFGSRAWTLVDHGPSHASLSLVSADGDEGYPGRVEATCHYRITGDGLLSIALDAVTDAPTLVNLAGHSYFNLDGEGDVRDHLLRVPAESYTPTDAGLIPTGAIDPVAGTPFDFRAARPIRYSVQGEPFGYDCNLVIDRAPAPLPRLHAEVTGPLTGTRLEVHSTEPGLQFYDGGGLVVPVAGLRGRRYGRHAGLCLEPQRFPDSPNHPGFSDAVLRPGERYAQRTEYRFSAG